MISFSIYTLVKLFRNLKNQKAFDFYVGVLENEAKLYLILTLHNQNEVFCKFQLVSDILVINRTNARTIVKLESELLDILKTISLKEAKETVFHLELNDTICSILDTEKNLIVSTSIITDVTLLDNIYHALTTNAIRDELLSINDLNKVMEFIGTMPYDISEIHLINNNIYLLNSSLSRILVIENQLISDINLRIKDIFNVYSLISNLSIIKSCISENRLCFDYIASKYGKSCNIDSAVIELATDSLDIEGAKYIDIIDSYKKDYSVDISKDYIKSLYNADPIAGTETYDFIVFNQPTRIYMRDLMWLNNIFHINKSSSIKLYYDSSKQLVKYSIKESSYGYFTLYTST